jgi:hypothetical protein
MHEVVHAFVSKLPSDETIGFGMNPRKPTRTKTKPNGIQMFLLQHECHSFLSDAWPDDFF